MQDLSRILTIRNVRGLHARAARQFVSCAGKFDAVVKVEKDGLTVEGTSILDLLMLTASIGTSIKVSASGAEAEEALEALAALVEAKFHEETS